jgi:predicted dehydrogenase
LSRETYPRSQTGQGITASWKPGNILKFNQNRHSTPLTAGYTGFLQMVREGAEPQAPGKDMLIKATILAVMAAIAA